MSTPAQMFQVESLYDRNFRFMKSDGEDILVIFHVFSPETIIVRIKPNGDKINEKDGSKYY